jgi:hypothetical protein
MPQLAVLLILEMQLSDLLFLLKKSGNLVRNPFNIIFFRFEYREFKIGR